jgi:hypothetical protein
MSEETRLESGGGGGGGGAEEHVHKRRGVSIIEAKPQLCGFPACRSPPSSSAGTRCKLKLCSGCSLISYCSQACQKNHWSEHKDYCKRAGFP